MNTTTNSSSPAGSLFNNSAMSTNSDTQEEVINLNVNSDTSNVNNSDNSDKNNAVEDIVFNLTTGATLLQDDSANQTGNNNNANTPQEYKDDAGNVITQNQSIINNLAKEYRGETFVPAEAMDKIAEGLQSGNLAPVTEAIEQASANGFNRAMDSMLKLIPEIIESTEQRVLSKVGEMGQVNDVWSEFLEEYPGYSKNNKRMQEDITTAIRAGKDKDSVFQAIDILYSGIKEKPTGRMEGVDMYSPEEASKPFDVRSILER